MNADTIKAVQTALTPLATKLGQGAEHVYGIYIKQEYANAATDFIWSIFLGALAFVAYKLVRYAIKVAKTESYSMWELGGIFIGIGGVISVLLAAACLTDGIQHLINPDFFAIQDLLASLTGK